MMNRTAFAERLKKAPLILDGAMGTELIKQGMPAGVCPELWCLEHPDAVRTIQQNYIDAGTQLLYTPTFGGNRCKLTEYHLESRLQEVNSQLAALSKKTAGSNALVFGDLAPTGRFVQPYGSLSFDDAVAIYREQAAALLSGGVDGLVIETMMDLQEARAAYFGAREAAPDLPIIVTMSFEASGRSLTGANPVSALVVFQSLGADAFGCNCSTGPDTMASILKTMQPYAKIPLVAKPNAGIPLLQNGKTIFPMCPAEFGEKSRLLFENGAALIGGCCGTTPAHLAALAQTVRPLGAPKYTETPAECVIASVARFRQLSPEQPFTLIGERINPTGKKALQAELREGKTELICSYALQQQEAGAPLLDVNMGLAGIDEAQMMAAAVSRLVRTVETPLVIDSTDARTMETALKLYPGRAVINSISAEKNRLDNILPLAKKYGAVPILLPITDAGIPASLQERQDIIEQLQRKLEETGLSPREICVDALIMAASAQPDAVEIALGMIDWCRQRKINSVCGLSNVSFGLPSRPLLNQTFLGMAIGRGLNMAIANPLFPEIIRAIDASDALLCRDQHQSRFIQKYNNLPKETATPATVPENDSKRLVYLAVLQGNTEGILPLLERLLNEKAAAPTEILNNILIPAITEVGKKYEKKEFFLPQLMMSAEAMQKATTWLEPRLGKASSEKKQKMIMATVKGDVHDIGKNIVVAILKNYGFDVIDLGKDVPAEVILDTAQRENVKIIGLSALMTTTMNAMRDVVNLARSKGMNNLTFILGGAVLNQEFANELGVLYAKDPMETVRLALQA